MPQTFDDPVVRAATEPPQKLPLLRPGDALKLTIVAFGLLFFLCLTGYAYLRLTQITQNPNATILPR
jgi:hypothetical protein